MKIARIIMLIAATSFPVMAQTSCPLQPILVKDVASQIAISLQNNSGKQVVSYTVGLTFYDVNGHAHAFPHHFTDSVQLSTHGRRTAIWNSPTAHQYLFPFAQAYLLEATFTDGTDWADDGSKSCSVISVEE
ncbi:MAG TPA: hypothetical protein VGU90_17000 [Terriglobales bacterium]|nr:hypothetical protein [Terriglobales bacterium]